MARFKNLQDLVKYEIKDINVPQYPLTSPESVILGQHLGGTRLVIEDNKDDFRWGFSTWGIDKITAEKFPKGMNGE